MEIGGYTYFPLHDIQGSLITLIQPNGNSCGCCRYTPFGEQTTKDHTSPWRFASKRYDPETDLIYFGRRYYSPNLGRWITADPQGFDDGPNLYAYVHNSPMITLDLHGLYSCYNTWTGMKNFGIGVGRQSWDMFSGIGHAAGSLGSWMAADSLYESGDPSLFHAKSQAAYDGWNALGSNFRNAPLRTTGELLVPGIMAAMHNPTSAEAWGRASVDIALLGSASRLGNGGRIGREATNFVSIGRTAERFQATSRKHTRFVGGVKLVDKRTGNILEGTVDLQPTFDRIHSGRKFPSRNDGAVFKNNENLLPKKSFGYYQEYVHPTPGINNPGPQRIVIGKYGEIYYSSDHYRTFLPIH